MAEIDDVNAKIKDLEEQLEKLKERKGTLDLGLSPGILLIDDKRSPVGGNRLVFIAAGCDKVIYVGGRYRHDTVSGFDSFHSLKSAVDEGVITIIRRITEKKEIFDGYI